MSNSAGQLDEYFGNCSGLNPLSVENHLVLQSFLVDGIPGRLSKNFAVYQ